MLYEIEEQVLKDGYKNNLNQKIYTKYIKGSMFSCIIRCHKCNFLSEPKNLILNAGQRIENECSNCRARNSYNIRGIKKYVEETII